MSDKPPRRLRKDAKMPHLTRFIGANGAVQWVVDMQSPVTGNPTMLTWPAPDRRTALNRLRSVERSMHLTQDMNPQAQHEAAAKWWFRRHPEERPPQAPKLPRIAFRVETWSHRRGVWRTLASGLVKTHTSREDFVHEFLTDYTSGRTMYHRAPANLYLGNVLAAVSNGAGHAQTAVSDNPASPTPSARKLRIVPQDPNQPPPSVRIGYQLRIVPQIDPNQEPAA